METLTRVLSRHVYNLDLANLPLDRVSGRIRSKNRNKNGGADGLAANQPTLSLTNEPLTRRTTSETPEGKFILLSKHHWRWDKVDFYNLFFDFIDIKKRERQTSVGTSSDRKSMVYSATTPNSKRKPMKRSVSDGNLASPSIKKVENETSTDEDSQSHSLVISGHREHEPLVDCFISPPDEVRQRKKSRSMDSLRTLKIAAQFGHIGKAGFLSENWAEISSSTTSLENTSTIHIDDTSSIGELT